MTFTYPNPPPFKLRTARAVTAALKTITPADGYKFDMSDSLDGHGKTVERVFRGRLWYGESDPIPMLSVLEDINIPNDIAEPRLTTKPAGEYDWPLLIQGWIDDDPVHPTDPAYVLLADVRQRLAVELTRFAPNSRRPDFFGLGIDGKNSITGMIIGPGVVRPADDISAKAYFWLSLNLRVFDNAAEPYA